MSRPDSCRNSKHHKKIATRRTAWRARHLERAAALGRPGRDRRRRRRARVARLRHDLGSGPRPADLEQSLRVLLEATERMTVASGIVSIWTHPPQATAALHARLDTDFPGRFLLGVGVSHAPSVAREGREYRRPRPRWSLPRRIGRADPPVAEAERIIAALAPKMLALARDRSLGSHPYLVTPEHTRVAREALGPDALLAPEQTVVVEPDTDRARAIARTWLEPYLRLRTTSGTCCASGSTRPTSSTAAATGSWTRRSRGAASRRSARGSTSIAPRAPITSRSRSRRPSRHGSPETNGAPLELRRPEAAARQGSTSRQITWPVVTASPAATDRSLTVPPGGRGSRSPSSSPRRCRSPAPPSTASPSATFTTSTVPCIGLTIRSCAAAEPAVQPALAPAARELAVRRLRLERPHLDAAPVDLDERHRLDQPPARAAPPGGAGQLGRLQRELLGLDEALARRRLDEARVSRAARGGSRAAS